MREIPLEVKADDTYYDIVVRGAHVFSNGKPKGVQCVSIHAGAKYKEQDPDDIRLYGSFNWGKPNYLSMGAIYEEKLPSLEAIARLAGSIPLKKFKITASKSETPKAVEDYFKAQRERFDAKLKRMDDVLEGKETTDYEEKEIEMPADLRDTWIYLTIEAPFGMGFANVMLPKQADWLDAAQFTSQLDKLRIRYKQEEYLDVKSFKIKKTPIADLLSVYEFFAQHGYKVKVEMGSMSPEIVLDMDERKKSIECKLSSLFPIKKKEASKLQSLFETHLSIPNAENYKLYPEFSEMKEKRMKIKYN